MTALESTLRKHLERTVVRAREVAEEGAGSVLQTLAVRRDDAHPTMDQAQRDLRTALRAKAKNLGEGSREAGYAPLSEEIAYEQWHRLLFARFLAENDLLMYAPGMPVSLAECAELAVEEGADNGWDLAGRYAARMLPGIFRAEDPAAQVRLAREHRAALEGLVADLPREVFTSDDGLGWTYQFWQGERKGEVNTSGVKIGARELAPVTQLFTEDYMVRFLLENSLGAWWAARHPESPLLEGMAYLRFAADSTPAAGSFTGWPQTVAELTVMDPCCGSGHFLVRAFHLLRLMRMEEEGLDAASAGDAVLRDNLFGLELDERCVQIAAFAVALEAWKSGSYRAIPAPQIACSGVPVAGQLEDWQKLAGDDVSLRDALAELYRQFRDAPSLGSLIDPHESIRLRPLVAPDTDSLARAMAKLRSADNGGAVAATIGETASAAGMLARFYNLIATNPPFLKRGDQGETLVDFCAKRHGDARADLATAFIDRGLAFARNSGTVAIVSPQNWLFLGTYKRARARWLETASWDLLAILGEGGFESTAAAGAFCALTVLTNTRPLPTSQFGMIDVSAESGPLEKSASLKGQDLVWVDQSSQKLNPDMRIGPQESSARTRLDRYAVGLQGISTSDASRFTRVFWEVANDCDSWSRKQSTVEDTQDYGGRSDMLLWEGGLGELANLPSAAIRGTSARGKLGVTVSQMRHLPVTLFTGDLFDNNAAVLIPHDVENLPAIWCFCSSDEFNIEVRKLDRKLWVTNATLVKVPFDLGHWQKVAAEQYPNGLPEPHSDDPTQWLFKGHPKGSDAPLQVAVARLLGYRWPEQPETDGLEGFADADGTVPLAPVRGEAPAADRLRALLAAAYGAEWSPAVQERLLAEVGFAGKDLAAWLADGKGFFAQHAKLFHNRPFIWQIWDGARDGFSVLVNYHKLTRGNLEKLIYTYLGDWIARQEQARDAGDATAESRLIKARELKAKLEAILAGEPPYDVYVRWKPLHEQPIGWDPDLNDGVRLNIRPFIAAGVLRAKFSVNWNKDRGDNPPGSTARQYAAEAQQAATNSKDFPSDDGRERFNDLHLTRAVKEAARAAHLAAVAAGGKE